MAGLFKLFKRKTCLTNEDEKYQEYKKEIERDDPASLRAKLESQRINHPYKRSAANRALREYEEAKQREAEEKREAHETEPLRLAREANEIARKGTVPGWLQIAGIIAGVILTGLGVYLGWLEVAFNMLGLIIGR